jgi:hypothetical protein
VPRASAARALPPTVSAGYSAAAPRPFCCPAERQPGFDVDACLAPVLPSFLTNR